MKKTQKKGFGAQDFNKQLSKFASPKLNKYGAPDMQALNTGGQIAANRFQAGMNTPNEYDDDADFYGRLGKIAGDKPSIASGFFSGLESATRKKANDERRSIKDKYDEVMAWMGDQNQRIIERLEEKDRDKFLEDTYLPQAYAYLMEAPKLDPIGREKTFNDMLEAYNEHAGTDLVLKSISGSNPNIVTLHSPSHNETQTVRISDFFRKGNNPGLYQDLDYMSPRFQLQLQAQRQQQEFENNLAREKLDIDRQGIPVNREKVTETRRRNDLMERSLEERQRGQNIKLNEKLGPRIKADRQFIERAPKLRKIVLDDPELFQSATRAIWDSQNKGDPSIISEFVKSINAKLNPERAKNVGILVKGINQMILDVSEGFARPSVYLEMRGGQAVPNLNMTASGYVDVLDNMVAEREFSLKQNLQTLKHLEATGEDGRSLYDIYSDGLDGMSTSNNTPVNDGKVSVRRKDTGEIIMVSPEVAKKAVQEGKGEIVK